MFELFQDKKKYFMICEYCEGGELFEEIVKRGSFGEKDAARVIEQILEGVSYCHDNKIVHRDIKPENLWIDSQADNSIKMFDF